MILAYYKKETWFKGDDKEIDNIQWITGSQSFKMMVSLQ